MKAAFRRVGAAYLAAGVGAVVVASAGPWQHPIAVAAAADVAATLVVFAFSFAYRNSSFYDAYWSVAPIAIVFYWILRPETPQVDGTRQLLLAALVVAWGLRLTFNWARGWEGLGHEDWRYVDLRHKTGRAYWLVSFVGLHMVPTVIVFLACLPLYAAVAAGSHPLGVLDGVAALVTAAAIAIEAGADHQLRRFRQSPHEPGDLLASGLWSWSRHPNYFGEMLFWWGLYLFALAAAPSWWWTIVGPLSITVMFFAASLPMIEERMLARRPSYAAHAQRTSLVIPRPPR